jgi:uncharacterized protein YhbP (UPF0306 family)
LLILRKMNLRRLIEDYLQNAILLQVATCENNQPWACTVHFAFDSDLNLYWMSLPTRRHSLEIQHNNKVAGVVVQPHKISDKARGIQLEGVAEMITDQEELKKVFPHYGKRFNRMDSLPRLLEGTNEHKLYRIKPTLYVLFDDVNFPSDPRQEYRL